MRILIAHHRHMSEFIQCQHIRIARDLIKPRHSYAKSLVSCVPSEVVHDGRNHWESIRGSIGLLLRFYVGVKFSSSFKNEITDQLTIVTHKDGLPQPHYFIALKTSITTRGL